MDGLFFAPAAILILFGLYTRKHNPLSYKSLISMTHQFSFLKFLRPRSTMMPTGKRARVESSDELELELELELESNNGGGDRISGLCNEILHHIFSFLPTRGVVQTCVLSKRWRNLWCSVPWLDFDEEEEDAVLASSSSNNSSKLQRAGSFSTFVNYVMLLRDGSNIQKLRLSCCSNNNTSNHVFDCVISAVRHNLQVLDLKILQNHHQSEPAEKVLPPSLFTCKSLTCLNLNNIVLPSYSSIHLSSLKTLHLISVKFPSLSTEALFSNSPNLETLTMQNCNFEHLKNFLISAKQLKNLIIIQDEASSSTSSKISITRIFAPNLISLKLHVDLHPGWYFLENLNSLVEANIHIKKPLCKYISLSFMIGIFCELRNAKAITLSGSCLQVIGKELISSSVETINARLHILRLRFMKSIETPFHNLKLLNLKTRFENGEVHAITDLLKRSPNIETLAIEYNSESSYEENELPLREEKLPSECTLHHLKTIQMHGFGGRKNELKLLTFLLENAKSLKKMIVEEASV